MQRDFCLGSEWLYYKIYTGVKTSDFILLEKLKPVIDLLIKKKIISQWFFVRYKDTDEHLRIRFLLSDTNHLAKVIKAFYPVFNELSSQNLIWKIQTDTYNREIERYGVKTMTNSEFLFWKDSEMILNYIEMKSDFNQPETPLLFSFYAINSLLNLFNLSGKEKLSLMDNLQISFKQEFEADKQLRKELSINYRSIQSQIEELFSNFSEDFNFIYHIVNTKSAQIGHVTSEIKNKLEISLYNFLSSHIHMIINRQYNSKQRMYELIIYDHLFRYYKTRHHKV